VRRGEAFPPPSPTGASNLQPVLHHAGVVSAQNRLTGELCVAVSPISCQRNLNLCGSPRSSSEFRKPLDVMSVCTRPAQHVADDRVGPYQPQVPGAEFGLGVRVRWRLALTSIGVPGPSLGNPPVVVFSLGLGGVPGEGPVAGQLSGTLPRRDPSHVARPLYIPVLGSRAGMCVCMRARSRACATHTACVHVSVRGTRVCVCLCESLLLLYMSPAPVMQVEFLRKH